MSRIDPVSRLMSKINKNGPIIKPHLGPCWTWKASFTHNGYGRFKYQGKTVLAHRYSYTVLKGPIPEGLTLDHICRNTACVNPDHLEPVTMKVNVLRGDTITAANSVKTHCNMGHELSGENLFIRSDGRRRCRTCERASQKRLRATEKFRVKHAAYERERRARKKT